MGGTHVNGNVQFILVIGTKLIIRWTMWKVLITNCSYIHCTDLLSELSECGQYLHSLLCVHIL